MSAPFLIHSLKQLAVELRRQFISRCLFAEGHSASALDKLPVKSFNESEYYGSIVGANCESVIGYVPVPVGVVGPLMLDGKPFRVPMSTTEGALLASTNRGCTAISQSGGANSVILANGMTRAPLLRVESVQEAAAIKAWVEEPVNAKLLEDAFNSTTRFGRLQNVRVRVAGRNVYVRFSCNCGDAMGMNMVTKGSVAALEVLTRVFPKATVLSLSGNVCADKKPSAVNWIEGRGRSVACEVVLKHDVIRKTLKTTAEALVDLNIRKNLVGSAMSGSLGGFNAHASNIVSAIFLATGNDIAQNVEASTCITLMEPHPEGLHMSVTMPSIEVGTVGGGTQLPAQAACLEMLGCRGANRASTGANADQLARIVAGTVLAGELSLMAALASGDLLKSHLELNRKPATPATTSASLPPKFQTDVKPMSASRYQLHTFGHPSSGGYRHNPYEKLALPTTPVASSRFRTFPAFTSQRPGNAHGAGPAQEALTMAGFKSRHTLAANFMSMPLPASSEDWYGETYVADAKDFLP